MDKLPTFAYHYFLDEAGDSTFYGKGRIPILGQPGVSNCFILGLLKINEPLYAIRKKVLDLQNQISEDHYYNKVASIQKKKPPMDIIYMPKMTSQRCVKLRLNLSDQ